MLLKDQLSHEELCIQKYREYAQRAQDPALKDLFNQYAAAEQTHYDTINQMLQGQVPQMGQGQAQGQSGQGQQMQMTQPQAQGQTGAAEANQGDALLCQDMLSTEKYVSSTYDVTIFEAVSPAVRQALQHIQREEQNHGEGIFRYMQAHGMYNPQ